MKKRVLSGIRATGRLHLGNYLGAVKGMLELQTPPAGGPDYETFYMVADLHTITTPYDVQELKKNKQEVVADYLAAGLDPEKSVIFYQSDLPEHIELAYYFSSVTTVAKMQHIPTFKEKVKLHPQNVTMALLNYPVLMASDILIYKPHLVPVGIDQEPHIEFTREIARRFNQDYGTDFPEPKRYETKGQYIPSLSGEGKMSKSVEGSFVTLTDSKDEIIKKIRSIPTATTAGGEMNEGVKALFVFAELFVKDQTDSFKKKFNNGSLQFSEMKDTVAAAIYKELKPIQEARSKIKKEEIEKVVQAGAEKARKIAQKTVAEVKEKIGLS